MTTRLPRPPALPFVGNRTTLDVDLPRSLLAKQYGEIYSLRIFNERFACVSTVKLAQEVLDEMRFHKVIDSTLTEVRNLGGDGLYTAHHGEPNWGIAHRILMPVMETLSIGNMFDNMVEVMSQLILKWERFGPRYEIDPTDDFTRLALDTIALCMFNYRLNTFYTEKDIPFVKAMENFSLECNMRVMKPGFIKALSFGANAKYAADIKVMNELASQIVQERKQNPIDKKDLLNAMLHGRDPQTGQGLSDSNLQAQVLTFFFAGIETTSGMLSFAMTHILKYPDVYAKIRKEVDTVLGKEPIKFEHLSKLTYITAVLRESLRMTPSIGEFAVTCDKDEIIGDGKYLIKKGTVVVLLVHTIARDPAVWGDDADTFNPDRMLNGKFEALPPKAWIPFGSGARACIGRPFSWQEALIALATIFQKFDLVPVDPAYDLQIRQTLTLKPKNFRFRAIPRKDAPSFSVISVSAPPVSRPLSFDSVATSSTKAGTPLYVFYGSNTGSCEGFAQTIASKAAASGFCSKIDTLDAASSSIPADGPVIIVTASFEGEPADNAGHFVTALTLASDTKDLGDVSYAVFGSGNHEWAQTYQRIPRLIDTSLEKRGAKRLLERGEGDTASNSFTESFNVWEEKLWDTLAEKYKVGAKGTSNIPSVEVQFIGGPTDQASALRQPDSKLGLVVENRLLTAPGTPPKRHIEFELPEDMTYHAGDYLAMVLLNPPQYVRRVLARFRVAPEQQIILKVAGPSTLPTGKPISISEVLSGFVEIGQVATKRNISTLLEYAKDASTRADLEVILANHNLKEGQPQSSSMLELLERYTDIDLPLGMFIASLPSMRLRQCSISSSPLWNPTHVTLTIGVVAQGQFLGGPSNYLAKLRKGDRVQMVVRPSAKVFHPPSDPNVPMVMFAAGSGIAPFRGFLQERAIQVQAGRQVAKSVLFFGCRKPDEDYLYADKELAEWSGLGVVNLRPAFSRIPEKSEGSKYVQHRIWADRDLIRQYYDQSAKFYTCGRSHIAAEIRDVLIRIIAERLDGDETQAEGILRKSQFCQRHATNVFW